MVKQMPWYIHATEYYSPMKSNELLINNTSHVSLGSYNEGKKKSNPKRSYTAWFHLYNIFEMTQF